MLAFFTCKEREKSEGHGPVGRPELESVYAKVYRLIEYGEYNLAFSELAYYLRFYTLEERKGFDIQNLFAKYIIEGSDSLENTIDNYARLFEFFNSADAEAVYQMLMYRSANESDLERAALIVASKVDKGSTDAGLYFFLTYTFYNLKMREQSDRYLDCLLSIAPHHPATSYLVFKIRGKRPNFRALAVDALRTLFYRDGSPSALRTIALNFHIPAMMNKEWEEIAFALLNSRDFQTRLLAYSEIPIFFARNNDAEALYKILKSQIVEKNYRLFSLATRSLLYVYKEPYVVVDRLRREFTDNPFVLMLYAKYLISTSPDNLNDAVQLCMDALEKDNNIEMLLESVELLSNTSNIFKLKSFAEELLFRYPYYIDLYNIYRTISSNSGKVDIFERYFEHIPESIERYLLFSYIVDNLKYKEGYLLNGLNVYKGDCRLIIELLDVENRCEAGDFFKKYNELIKNYVTKEEMLSCISKMEENRKVIYLSLVNQGKRGHCAVEKK